MRLFNKTTLRKRILTGTGIVFSVAAFVIALSVFLLVSETFTNNSKENLNVFVGNQALELQHKFEDSEKVVAQIAGYESVIDYFGGEKQVQDPVISNYLKQYNSTNEYLNLYLLDMNGNAIVSLDPRFIDNNYSFREYYKEALAGNSFLDSDIGVTTSELGYYFSKPVKKDGQVIGIVVAKLHPSAINTILEASKQYPNSSIMFTGQYGVVLYSDKSDRYLMSLGQLSATSLGKITETNRFGGKEIKPLDYDIIQKKVNDKMTGVQVFDFFDSGDNENEIVSVARIGDKPYYLIFELDKESLVSTSLFVAGLSSVIIIVALSLAITVMALIISRTVRPLEVLRRAALSISENKFPKPTNIQTGDEFEDLGFAFDKMALALLESRRGLEQKIEERTADMQKFQLAVAGASDHIVITDPEGIVIFANKSVEKITGFSNSEVVGKKAGSKELWGGQMAPEIYRDFWITIKTKKKPYIGVFNNRRKNGTMYEAAATISPILDDKGEVIYFVGIERDVTREKEVDKAKTEFVSLASHQLRTPLSAINWYTEMLLEGDAGKINKTQKEYLDEIYVGNQRMVDLVNSLLDVSRLDLGTFSINPEKVVIADVISDVALEMKHQIDEKKQKFSVTASGSIPSVMADPKLLRIIIQNLVSNAVKYTPVGGKIVVAAKYNARTPKEAFVITVTDNGMGIPQAQKEIIFTKLFRADNVRVTDTEGTGLGLYITRSILNEAGGSITFTSKENTGTVFTVTLPASGMKSRSGSKAIE